MSRSSNVFNIPLTRSVMDYLSQVKADAKSGRFILLEKEKPLHGYATFTGLQLMIGKEPMFTECTVSFTNQRLLMTRKLSPSSNGEIVGWALDRQFIHAIKDCAGGLFKSSKRVRLVIKDPRLKHPTEEDYFELQFPEEDFFELKRSFLNVLKIVELCQACDEDRLEDFQILLQSNPTLVNIPIDSRRNTLFIMACARNKAAFARYLLQFRDIYINKTTTVQVMRDGKLSLEIYGALYYACINNMEEVVHDLLLIPTVDLNILYTDEYTALQYALRKDIECQLAFASNPNSKRISYAKVVSMLMSSRKATWKIGENKIFAIPEKWILNATSDTQKAILLCSRVNELPADLKQKLATSIQEKQRKTQSYNGKIARTSSSSTIATEDIESSSKICNIDSFHIIDSNIVNPTMSGVVNNDPIADEIDPRCLGITPTMVSIEKQLPKPQNKKGFENIPAFHLQPPVSDHYFNETVDENKVQIKSVILPSEEDQTYLEFSSKICKSQSSQSVSSKIGDVDVFTEELILDLLRHLGLTPTLQLSFVILNILKLEDDISIARSLNLPKTIEHSSKLMKPWKLWKEEIHSQLPEPLYGEDFESIKKSVLAEIEKMYDNCIKETDEETFEALKQLKLQIESFVKTGFSDIDPLVKKARALFKRLKLTPAEQLSFVILNILKVDDDICISKSSDQATVFAKQRKPLMLWKEEILASIYKPLPEPLNREDFESTKTFVLAEIEKIFDNCIRETADEETFETLDQIKDQIQNLFLSSKESKTDFTNIDTSSTEIKLHQPYDELADKGFSKDKGEAEGLVSSKGQQKEHLLEVTAGPTSSPVIQISFPLPVNKTSHVFIAHAWAEDEKGRNNHLRAKRLKDVLKKRGIMTWFDDDGIHEDTRSLRIKLSKALYSTCCVLVCITRKYEEKINSEDMSDNCLFEFNVATNDKELSNAIMTAVMESSMLDVDTWERGILKAELGHRVYTDLSSDINFEENCEEIVKNVVKMLQSLKYFATNS